MEIGMSNVDLVVFGLTALLVVVVAVVARRGQTHLLPTSPRRAARKDGHTPRQLHQIKDRQRVARPSDAFGSTRWSAGARMRRCLTTFSGS